MTTAVCREFARRHRWLRNLTSWKSAGRPLSSTSNTFNIVKSEVEDLDLPTGNFFNTVFKDVSKWGDKIAAECSVTGRRYTYGSLMDKASRWGGMLKKLGVGRGDTVALALTNCPEYPIAFFGAMSIGACVTTISSSFTAEEVYRQLNDSGASVLVGDPLIQGVLKGAIDSYKRPLHLFVNGPSNIPGAIDFQQVLDDPTIPYVDPATMSGEEIAVLPYSSGTTGPPKGVSITHDALSAGVISFLHPYSFCVNETTAENQEAFNCVLPFYHVYGMVPIMSVGLAKGLKLVTVPKFDANSFVETIRQHKVSFLHLVPPILNFLINSPTANAKSMSSVRSLLCGAAPVPPSGAQAMMDKLGREIFFQEGYGMTETLIVSLLPAGHNRLGTIGKLLPNIMGKVVDLSTGEALPTNEEGEICVKGPTLMAGYHNNQKATEETIDKDGWLHTGDVGLYDEEGFFKIVDRCKELIKVKGLQVSPSELEDIVLQHPDVADVGILGIPHDRLGEAPRAYIVAKGNVTEEDINKFLNPRISSHKKLAGGIKFVDALPKSPTGKLLRRELKKLANNES